MEQRQRRVGRLVELGILLVVALVLSLVVRANVAQAFYIPSGSMEPQLEVGDRVVVSRTAYRLHDVHRGDIVVFPAPGSSELDDPDPLPKRVVKDVLAGVGLRHSGEDLIKRVVALPGETVGAQDGHLVIDGRQLLEPYLSDEVVTSDFGPLVVPEGHVFVMGDNRGNSQDSRVIGPIEIGSIVGRAVARVWPPDRTAFL
jgi:signal peptidase I